MNKIVLHMMLLSGVLFGFEPTIAKTTLRSFSKSLKLNAQIIQLSNASQSIMSVVDGHIEEYYVKVGERVKKGQKLALVRSISISKMSAEFIALKNQFLAQQKNLTLTEKLFDSGMASMQELNVQSIQLDEISAQLNALQSQLGALGIDTKRLQKATADFILYAHSDGMVSEILQSLHANIQKQSPIIRILKEQAFYIKLFVPLEYSQKIALGQKVVIMPNHQHITSYVSQILPMVDTQTQRIILLAKIQDITESLFINAYVEATLYFDTPTQYVAIQKSALAFFQNEWVVFTPEEEHDEHDEEGHDEDEKDFGIKVLKIIMQDDNYVAVDGIGVGEEYVSEKSYYIKSQLLKSSLGGHGH